MSGGVGFNEAFKVGNLDESRSVDLVRLQLLGLHESVDRRKGGCDVGRSLPRP